jgi:hypothetical protein
MVLVEIQLTVLGPHCWPHPLAGGLGQVAGRRAGSGPALWGGGHPTTRKVSHVLRKVSRVLRKVSCVLRKVSHILRKVGSVKIVLF